MRAPVECTTRRKAARRAAPTARQSLTAKTMGETCTMHRSMQNGHIIVMRVHTHTTCCGSYCMALVTHAFQYANVHTIFDMGYSTFLDVQFDRQCAI